MFLVLIKFVYFLGTGSYCVVQVGPELLGSNPSCKPQMIRSQLEVFSMRSEVEPSSGYIWRLQFICTMLRLGHLGEHTPASLSSFFQEAPTCFSVEPALPRGCVTPLSSLIKHLLNAESCPKDITCFGFWH